MNKYVTNLTLPNGTNVLIKDSECRTNLSNEIRRATAKETELKEADTHLRNDLTTETNARKQNENKNNAEIANIHSNITAIENKNTEQDDELGTLRTMLSSPYNFKGDVASISALPASGKVNDTYYVQDVKYKVTWTGSAWVQSSLSEADYQTEFSELKDDLDKYLLLESDFTFTNLIPKTDGTFFEDKAQSPNWFSNGYTVIPYGVKAIEFKGASYNEAGIEISPIAFYDINKNFISCYPAIYGQPANVVGVIEVPTNAKYFIQTHYKGIPSITKYLYNNYIFSDFIIVDINGKGDFTKLSDAINNASDDDIILVMPGIYENETCKAWNKNNLTIIGLDKYKCIVKNNTNAYTTPCLEIANGIIKNLSFIQDKNVSNPITNDYPYAVHIENDNLENNNLIFENCLFYSKYSASVGIGTKVNSLIIFDKCTFQSDHLLNSRDVHIGALFIHPSNTTMGSNQNVNIVNCNLESKYGSALHIEEYGTSENKLDITIQKSFLYSDQFGDSNVISKQISGQSVTIFTNKSYANNINVSEYNN